MVPTTDRAQTSSIEYKVRTGYFRRDHANPGAVSIARSMPPIAGKPPIPVYNKLQPPEWLLNAYLAYKANPDGGGIAEPEYERIYRTEVLYRLSERGVYTDLLDLMEQKAVAQEIGAVPVPVLLCWEKSGEFCHRHIVADWLSERGIPTAELGIKVDIYIENGEDWVIGNHD